MTFLLDTDICSAHMRRPAKLAHRFVQYTSQIAISSVTLAELYAGAYKHSQTNRLLALIADLLQEVQVIGCPGHTVWLTGFNVTTGTLFIVSNAAVLATFAAHALLNRARYRLPFINQEPAHLRV